MKLILLCALALSMSFGSDQVFASCSNAKTDLYDLEKETSSGYTKGSMTVDLLRRNDRVYLRSSLGESELLYVSTGTDSDYFVEKTSAGNIVLFTYYKQLKILTIQKSYSLSGAIMVNTYLKCE